MLSAIEQKQLSRHGELIENEADGGGNIRRRRSPLERQRALLGGEVDGRLRFGAALTPQPGAIASRLNALINTGEYDATQDGFQPVSAVG